MQSVPITTNGVSSNPAKVGVLDTTLCDKVFSMSGINSGRLNQTMLNLCGIVATILKMATGRHFLMSGIISGHHNLPTYEMSLKSDNVEFMRYCGGHL